MRRSQPIRPSFMIVSVVTGVLAVGVIAVQASRGGDQQTTIIASGGVLSSDELPAPGARSLAAVSQSRFGLTSDRVHVVKVSDSASISVAVGSDIIDEEHEEVGWIAWASGDFVDRFAHPPAGYSLPTGKTAYWVFDPNGQLVGGGLLIKDVSARLGDLGNAVSLSELGA